MIDPKLSPPNAPYLLSRLVRRDNGGQCPPYNYLFEKINTVINNWLIKTFQWFWKLWDILDEKTKARILEEVVKSFEVLFRAFYKSKKRGK